MDTGYFKNFRFPLSFCSFGMLNILESTFDEIREAVLDKDYFLIKRIKHGDEDAMETFVRQYYGMILKYCAYRIMRKDEAESITQETFVKFFSAVPGYRHSGKALNFLYTIAKNLCADFNRKSAAEESARESIIMENSVSPVVETSGKTDLKIDIERALSTISEELREVIMLFYFQDMKEKDIARMLGIGLSLVKYRLRRGKEELAKIMSEEDVL